MAKKPRTVVTPAPVNPEQAVTPPVVVEAAPVVERPESTVAPMTAAADSTPVEIVAEAPASTVAAVDTGVAVVAEKKFSTPYNLITIAIDAYAKEMHPSKPMDATDGANHQSKLFRALKGIFSLNDTSEFIAAANYALGVFHQGATTTFSHAYLYRFMESVPVANKTELELFSGLLRLFSQCANPVTRRETALRMNTNKLSELLGGGIAGQRLVEFFKN